MIYLAGYLILFGAALLFVLGMCRAASEPVNQGHPHPDTDQAAVAGVVQVRDSRGASLSSVPAPKTTSGPSADLQAVGADGPEEGS